MSSLAPNFRELISDIKSQPEWRSLAQRCADYYDHEQLTQAQRKALQDLGMPDITENLVQAPVNSVLGNEEQRRRDWMVMADDDDSQEVAEGLNARLNEQLRLTEANSQCSEAYAGQIKSGVGWLHVRRNDDPFGSEYKIEHVHRDEVFWDMRGRARDLSESRWLARRRFMDVDEAKAFLPEKYHQLVDVVASRWQSGLDSWEFAPEMAGRVDAMYSEWQSSSANIEFIMDSNRRRVAIYEVYYRVFVDVLVLSHADGRREELDKENTEHVMAVLSGDATVRKAKSKKMRRRWFIGPHQIADEVSPYPHDLFPYVAFFGYREDANNSPYGIIRSMLDPQDAYNNATMRIHHILNSKRIVKGENASNDDNATLQHEAYRKDGLIELREGKVYGRDFVIEQDWNELQKLFGLRDSHAQKIRDCSGVYEAFSGQAAASQSGVAISNLAELGAVTLAEINANYEYGRKKVAEMLLAYIVHDMGSRQTIVHAKQDHGQNPKMIVLNADPMQARKGEDGVWEVDRTGMALNGHSQAQNMTNSVTRAKYQVVLAPIQSSPGYRQHQHMRLMEMYQVSPDSIKMEMFPMVIESSEMPRREEFIKKWNEKMGGAVDPEQQALQQQAALEQQQQEMELIRKERESKIAVDEAKALEHQAEADLRQSQSAKTIAETEGLREKQRRDEADAKSAKVNEVRQKMVGRELAVL